VRRYTPAMAPDSVWEIVFLMVILKIPIVYLCAVIYYAIKAEPRPEEGAAVTAELGPDHDDGGTRRRRLPRLPRPHGSPARRYPRTPQPSAARMRADDR
jgi:hypothetical protein